MFTGQQKDQMQNTSCATVFFAGKMSQGQREGGLRVRKVTANSVFHQNCIVPEENGIDFVEDI